MDKETNYSSQGEILEWESIELPPEYKVIFHNDDFTTMEFVVDLLVTVFKKNVDDAVKIMSEIHTQGKGIVGIYSYDMAHTRTKVALQRARENKFPLRITVEEN